MRKLLGVFLLALAMLAPIASESLAQNSQVMGYLAQGNATLSVTTSSARVALATNSSNGSYNAIVTNTGAVDAHIALGSVTVTAATTDFLVPAGQWRGIAIGSQTYLAAITGSSTTTLDISTGKGTPLGGAGSSTGGGGGSVTQGTTPWLVAGQGTAGVPGTAALTVQGIGSGTPVPISAASLPLPTGAATAANQPGFGTAGSANANVMTVQGVASMTKILVTPDSVALPANQSVNNAQVNGVTLSTGAGATGTGTQRVGVAQDTTTVAGSAPGTAGSASTNVMTVQGIASMTKLLVTPDSVALPANQSVNAAQINGVTPLMGNGATGTGSPRVTVASDNTPFPIKIDQTTPDSTNLVSSKPSVATWVGGTASQTSTTSTSLIPLVAAKSIYVMAFNCTNSGASDSIITFQDGSGGAALDVTINKTVGGSNHDGGGVPLFKTTAGNALFFAPGTASTTQYCTASGFSQ